MFRGPSMRSLVLGCAILSSGSSVRSAQSAASDLSVPSVLRQLDSPRGIAVILGDPDAKLTLQLARQSELLICVQLPSAEQVAAVRRVLDGAGLLNRRVYVEEGTAARIHLADNLADVVLECSKEAAADVQGELPRVLRPGGKAWFSGKTLTKPYPPGTDDWSHPYHGPDNNPASGDTQAKAPYLTQFLAEPYYVPLPALTVTAAGRVFKAFGHVGFKQREWPWLNTLAAFNGYNGTLLWRRPLSEGFNIHRNTMVATRHTLFVADDTACTLFDTATGEPTGQIAAPSDAAGKVWNWMALEGDVLYALTGGQEFRDATLRGDKTSAGWPWRPMTEGYDREESSWARGTTFLALTPLTKKILWKHEEPQPVDGRAVCMADGRIYYDRILYSPKRYWQGYFYTGPLCQAYAGDVVVRGGERFIARIDPATAARWTQDLWHTEVPPKKLWQNDRFETAQAVVLGKNAAVFAGQIKARDASEPRFAMAAVGLAKGDVLWVEPLPAMPVPFGLATDSEGRLVVTTEDGRVLCFAIR